MVTRGSAEGGEVDRFLLGGGAEPHERLHGGVGIDVELDRKSTRLNSSHTVISYAVFCLKKKTRRRRPARPPGRRRQPRGRRATGVSGACATGRVQTTPPSPAPCPPPTAPPASPLTSVTP